MKERGQKTQTVKRHKEKTITIKQAVCGGAASTINLAAAALCHNQPGGNGFCRVQAMQQHKGRKHKQQSIWLLRCCIAAHDAATRKLHK